MAVRFVRDAAGEVQAVRLLIRKINGQTLLTLNSGELFLYRQELSEFRPSPNSSTITIASWTTTCGPAATGGPITLMPGWLTSGGGCAGSVGADYFNRGFVGIDHYYARSYKNTFNGVPEGIANHAPGTGEYIRDAKLHMMERSLTYNDAKRAVDEIMKLADPQNPAELKDLLTATYTEIYPDDPHVADYVTEAMEVLHIRASKLEEVTKALNSAAAGRCGVPPTGCLPGIRLFVLPQLPVAIWARLDQQTAMAA